MLSTHLSTGAAATHTASDTGTVVAPHQASIAAGMSMYEQGGNAVDAAVSAALVAGVIEPTETTLLGSGFMLLQEEQQQPWSIDFGPKAPQAASAAMFQIDAEASSSAVLGLAPVVDNANVDGPLAAGVPRTLLGLLRAQERFGTLSRQAVCAPAIQAAYDGFDADMWFLISALHDVARLRRDPQAAKTFLDDEGLPKGRTSASYYGPSFDARHKIRQPLLGATLEELAEADVEILTTGSIAQRLVETSRELGGLLRSEDLAAADPSIGPARTMRYRDVEVAVPNAPGGGLTELQILAIWEALHPTPVTPHQHPDRLRELALTIRRAFADRYHWLGDSTRVPVPESELLSAPYASHIASLVAQGEDVEGWQRGAPWITYSSQAVHNPWDFSAETNRPPHWNPTTASTPTSGTTHISAADATGRTVSITHTAANGFGNGIVCPRTGMLFDSAMAWFNAAPGAANSITPGGRALANMGPALISHQGQSIAALGASGGRRIISAVAQLIIFLVDGRQSLAEALTAPRIDASGPNILLPVALQDHMGALEDLGVSILPASPEPYVMDFARPNIAGFTADGRPISAISAQHYDH